MNGWEMLGDVGAALVAAVFGIAMFVGAVDVPAWVAFLVLPGYLAMAIGGGAALFKGDKP